MPLVIDPAGDLDVIVALATPPGVSALAVVRMSGPDGVPRRILSALAPESASIQSRVARLLRLTDGGGNPLDEAMTLFFAAPASATGEEVVEISCHGSPAVVAALLETLRKAGARPARRGEFTRRALRNGKLDLARAEGLLALLGAESRKRASDAYGMLRGDLSERIHGFRERILDLLAVLEGSLDFAEDLPEVDPAAVLPEIRGIERDLDAFLRLTEVGRDGEDLPNIVILGRPNAGKSTLFNVFLGIDRAIVTDVPGTTRDAIRETVVWHGERVRLNDTAGLRESGDAIERIGAAIARDAADAADLVLYVVDSRHGVLPEDRLALSRLDRERTILVFSKTDLAPEPASAVEGVASVAISSRTGRGIDTLRDLSSTRLGLVEKGGGLFVVARQREALERTAREIRDLAREFEMAAPELWAAGLRRALSALGEITGETATEDLLDRIFSKFCVGK